MRDADEVSFRGKLTPVRDQGRRSTCLPHAISAAHEFLRASAEHLSPEYLYHFAKSRPGGGCKFSVAAQGLRDRGQPTEAECPSLPAEPPAGWGLPSPVTAYRRESDLPSANVADIKAAIRSGALPVLGISLPDSFFRPGGAPWVIESSGSIRGRHAVLGVGLGTRGAKEATLVRNSWGSGWADGGYAWLTDAFLSAHLRYVMILGADIA